MKQAVWILSLLSIALLFTERIAISYAVETLDTETILGTKEDPMARITFENRRLSNPKTGQVPINIRERELAFDAFIQKQPVYLKQSASRKAETLWELAGPFNVGGRTRGAGIDIRDEDILLAAGVSGGIWKTTDGGISWNRTTHPDIHNGISYMVQDTRVGKENIWYAGTGEQVGNSARGVGAVYRGNGMLKSIDNGNSWSALASTTGTPGHIFNSQFQYIWNIVLNKKKSTINEVFAACYGGILRSQDGGDSWEVVLGNKLFDLPPDTDINTSNDPSYTHIHQNTSGHFFASLSSASSVNQNYPQGGFYFSEDGETWVGGGKRKKDTQKQTQ